MQINPLGKRILIQQLKEEQKGLLLMPESAAQKEFAVIIALSPMSDYSEAYKVLCVGDKVIYNKHGGQKVNIDKDEYLLVREEDILAKIT